MKKRGQFAIIAIIGVVILIAILGVLYFQNQQSQQIIDRAVSQDSFEDNAVKQFVASCLRETAKKGLQKAGLQGGYINPDRHGYYLNPSLLPTEQKVLEAAPGSNILIPYWFHTKPTNGCGEYCPFSEAPRLSGNNKSVKTQLEKYINKEIQVCLNGFTSLRNYDSVEPKRDPSSSVIFSEDTVVLDLDYPLELIEGEKTDTVNSYRTELDVSFKRVYLTALLLTNYLQQTNFFEEAISLPILSTHSMGEEPDIPPIGGDALFEAVGPWSVAEIIDNLKSYLNDEISKIALEGTEGANVILTEDIIINDMSRNLVLPSDGADYSIIENSDLAVNFDYLPWWNIYLDITGEGSGDSVVTAPTISMPGIGVILPPMTIANFVYDLSYPVMITVSDPDAFAGEGYAFRFAIESNVMNNNAVRNNLTGGVIEAGGVGTFLCDPEQRNSGLITVSVSNELTGKMLSDANVKFVCGQETCFLGETEEGILSMNFPLCANGEIEVARDGFGNVRRDLTTILDKESSVDVTLMPEFEIEVEVKKIMLEKQVTPEYASNFLIEPVWKLTSEVENLKLGEEASLILTKVDDTDYQRAIHYKGNLVAQDTLLLPGKYRVTGFLNGEPEIIAGQVIEGVQFDEMENTFVGKVNIDNVEIKSSDLRKGKVTFYVAAVKPGAISRHLDMTVVAKVDEIISNNPDKFRPTFS